MEHQEQLITLVEKQKRNTHRYNIFINGLFAFSVHEDMLVKYRLLKGEAIEAQTIDEVIREDERHIAYTEALRFIGRRPRSAKEVRLKLKQNGHDPVLVEWVLERLTEQQYINDEQVAQMWAEHRIYSQKKGRMWVKQELQQKGISPDKINRAVTGIDPEAEFQAALEIAVKKWNVTPGDKTGRLRKVIAFLQRRGFTNELIGSVIRHLNTGPSVDESLEDLTT